MIILSLIEFFWGYKTFTEEPDGSYIICPVCFWEDDPVQLENPDLAGGANRTSLRQAHKNFMEFGACDEGMRRKVRLPNDDEPKEDGWRPFD